MHQKQWLWVAAVGLWGCQPSTAREASQEAVGVARAALVHGAVQDGHPNDFERMVLVLTNQSRHSAQTPANECGEWSAEVGADVKKRPLVWTHEGGVAARFQSRHLSENGCFQHESCCELGDVGGGTIGCVAPGSCSGSGCQRSCQAPNNSPAARYHLLGFQTYSGENIAMGQPSAYAAWCAWMLSDGHRKNIYSGHTQLGVGAFLPQGQACSGWYWTQGFGSAQVDIPRIAAASAMFAPPQPRDTREVYFAANYYDPAGKGPKRAAVVVNGRCFDLERAWGYPDNGTYEARFDEADDLPPGCHPYYFLVVDDAAERHTYPAQGSLQLALGSSASCPTAYDASAQKPADCETGAQECQEGDVRSCYTEDPATLNQGECKAGHQVCKNGFWSACRQMQGPFPERCDGLDNDCDGEVDEGNPEAGASCEQSGERGVCKQGTLQCISGHVSCRPVQEPSPEVCNGVDDDCDGVVDDGFGLLTCGVGECFRSVPACHQGVPGTCTPGTPSVEVADFRDNDCNGLVDDGIDCRSADGGGIGRPRPCYSAAQGLSDGGTAPVRQPCRGGLQFCQADAGWGGCEGEQLPAPEVCDGADNDCDGEVDENEELGWERCGAGACASFNAVCRSGQPLTCAPGQPSPELCNGVDDDCDGVVDPGCLCREGDAYPCYSGPSQTLGLGACKEGERRCEGGRYGVCAGEVVPSVEVCNGVDDDCDGEVDDDCVPDASADAGVGADNGAPAASGGPESEAAAGCGCGAGASAAGSWWGLLALVGARATRRRRG